MDPKICPSCREKNNPTFTKCWKCGSSLAGGASSSSGEATSSIQGVMERKLKQVQAYEEELKKPNPTMSLQEVAHYFYFKIQADVMSVLADRDFLCKAGIEKVSPSQLGDELFYLFVFAFDITCHRVFGSNVKNDLMRNLLAFWLRDIVGTGGDPNCGPKTYDRYLERVKEYLEAFKAFEKDRNPVMGVGFTALCNIKGIPTKGTGFLNGIKDGKVNVIQALAMDVVFFKCALEPFQEMLSNCKKISCLSMG